MHILFRKESQYDFIKIGTTGETRTQPSFSFVASGSSNWASVVLKMPYFFAHFLTELSDTPNIFPICVHDVLLINLLSSSFDGLFTFLFEKDLHFIEQ